MTVAPQEQVTRINGLGGRSRLYTVLAGGVGAARFLRGLVEVVDPKSIVVVVNTGDDKSFYGLRVSPDIDINLYSLAGIINPEHNWGVAGDTFRALEMLRRYGQDTWFALGDSDLATHIYRTWQLGLGRPLSRITQELGERLGIGPRLLPMTDDVVETMIETPNGDLDFQEYLVQRGTQDEVLGVHFRGIESASPAPGVLEAIRESEVILIPPSNPIVSVGTILAVPGIREAILAADAPVVGVSPIVGGKTIKGPADKLLRALGYEATPLAVAQYYGNLLDGWVLDSKDASSASKVERTGLRVAVTDTDLSNMEKRRIVARTCLELAGS